MPSIEPWWNVCSWIFPFSNLIVCYLLYSFENYFCDLDPSLSNVCQIICSIMQLIYTPFSESFVEFLIFTMPILSPFPSSLFYFGAYPKCSSTICWKTILELLLHLCQRSIVWSIYGFSSLFHWSLCLPLCQYHTPLIAVAI